QNTDIARTIDHFLGATPPGGEKAPPIPRGTPPTAVADSFTVAKNSNNNALNILGNDSANLAGGTLGLIDITGVNGKEPITGEGANPDGSVSRQIKTAHGTITVSQDGTHVSYTPD